MVPESPLHATAVGPLTFSADHLAAAWHDLAPLPDGRWAVQFGGWCQGVGSIDRPWTAYPGRAECLLHFLAAAEELCARPVPGLAGVQQAARERLLALLDAHAEIALN